MPVAQRNELEAFRSIGDPAADAVVASILTGNSDDTWNITSLFAKMVRNADPLPDGLPDSCRAFFKQCEAMPDWVDPQKIRMGLDIFRDNGPQVVLLLFCKSLPLAYGCWRGAEVLTRTGRLSENVADSGADRFLVINRRIMETAQFVLNVMAPDAFDDEGRGIRTAQKIRLIHASIRHYLREGDWDQSQYGVPINQEDMAGTLMSFSFSVIEGLAELNIELTTAEQEAYLHTWRVIGHFMGLDPALLPESMAQARQLTTDILDRQTGHSAAGVSLTRSLTDYLNYLRKIKIMPARLPSMLIRYLVGDQRAELLGVAEVNSLRAKFDIWLIRLVFGEFGRLDDRSQLFERLSGHFSRLLLQGLTLAHNDFKAIRFYIPPSLEQDWALGKR